MAFRSDERGQMILLAGVLIILAYLLLATQAALIANVGQEAGRESATTLLPDYAATRSALTNTLRLELTDSAGLVKCPTDAAAWQGRVLGQLSLLEQLEANRGQNLVAHYFGDNMPPVPPTDADGDGDRDLKTTIDLYITDGQGALFDRFEILIECTP